MDFWVATTHFVHQLRVKCRSWIRVILVVIVLVFYRAHTSGRQKAARDCPHLPTQLVGGFTPEMHPLRFEEIKERNPQIQQGGHWQPSECRSRQHVAIIVPYRNREDQLKVLLTNLLPFLQRQQTHFQIFIVSCPPEATFNRAKLMNIGFKEATKMGNFDCFVFHDVDLIPEDDRNLYRCHKIHARHLSVNIDKYNYTLLYEQLIGGVTLFSKTLFQQINGYANSYWGWGGEDDDMKIRLSVFNKTAIRYPTDVSRYRMIKHEHERENPVNKCRYHLLNRAKVRLPKDGLSDLHYKVINITLEPLYTLIMADVLEMSSVVRSLTEAPYLKKCWMETNREAKRSFTATEATNVQAGSTIVYSPPSATESVATNKTVI